MFINLSAMHFDPVLNQPLFYTHPRLTRAEPCNRQQELNYKHGKRPIFSGLGAARAPASPLSPEQPAALSLGLLPSVR